MSIIGSALACAYQARTHEIVRLQGQMELLDQGGCEAVGDAQSWTMLDLFKFEVKSFEDDIHLGVAGILGQCEKKR